MIAEAASRYAVARAWSAVIASRRARLALGAGAFLLLTIVWNLPVALHPTTKVLGGPADGTLSIRSSWILVYEGRNAFTAVHDSLNGAPEGLPVANAVAWFEPIQPAFLLVFHWIVGWIGAWNIFLLSGFFLTGFFGFLLLDNLAFHPLVSFFGGYVLAFNPWMFERAYAGHAGFVHAWVFPALLIALLKLSRERTIRSALLVGLVYGIAFLDASYYGLVATVLVATYAVFELVRTRGLTERLWTISLASAASMVLLVLLTPGVIKYSLDHNVVSSSISNSGLEAHRLGADLSEYFLPDYQHPVFGSITRSYAPSRNFSEGTLFFGYTTIVLALIGVVMLVRRPRIIGEGPIDRRRAILFAAILVPIALWASLKTIFQLGPIAVPSLSWFVTQVTTYFRVYARIGVLVALGLVVLAAPTLEWIVRRGRRGQAAVVVLTGVAAFELLAGPVHGWAATKVPAYDQWLARQPRGIVANYPLPTDKSAALDLEAHEIYYQMFVKQPLYNLFGPGTGDTREDAIRIVSRYVTDPRTPGILAAERVRYVVLHDDVYAKEGQPPPQVSSNIFRLVKRFPHVRIYVLRRSVPASDLGTVLDQSAVEIGLVQGLQAPAASLGSFGPPADGGWRTFRSGATIKLENSDVVVSRIQLVVHLRSAAPSASVTLADSHGDVARSAAVGGADTQVTLGPFPIPQGSSLFTLRTNGDRPMQLGEMLIQPLPDFSNSLAATG